jgi:hypothetical protein
MQKISTLLRLSYFKRTLQTLLDEFNEALESPEKRQYRILKKFISE